jgi:rRNA maturation endonuclease Nob1
MEEQDICREIAKNMRTSIDNINRLTDEMVLQPNDGIKAKNIAEIVVEVASIALGINSINTITKQMVDRIISYRCPHCHKLTNENPCVYCGTKVVRAVAPPCP